MHLSKVYPYFQTVWLNINDEQYTKATTKQWIKKFFLQLHFVILSF